jgi:hypothetical protein
VSSDSIGMLIFGIILLGIGFGYLFSDRFITFALGNTTQGVIWSKLLGEKWSRLVSKLVFSAAAMAFGAWCVYGAFYGLPAP